MHVEREHFVVFFHFDRLHETDFVMLRVFFDPGSNVSRIIFFFQFPSLMRTDWPQVQTEIRLNDLLPIVGSSFNKKHCMIYKLCVKCDESNRNVALAAVAQQYHIASIDRHMRTAHVMC